MGGSMRRLMRGGPDKIKAMAAINEKNIKANEGFPLAKTREPLIEHPISKIVETIHGRVSASESDILTDIPDSISLSRDAISFNRKLNDEPISGGHPFRDTQALSREYIRKLGIDVKTLDSIPDSIFAEKPMELAIFLTSIVFDPELYPNEVREIALAALKRLLKSHGGKNSKIVAFLAPVALGVKEQNRMSRASKEIIREVKKFGLSTVDLSHITASDMMKKIMPDNDFEPACASLSEKIVQIYLTLTASAGMIGGAVQIPIWIYTAFTAITADPVGGVIYALCGILPGAYIGAYVGAAAGLIPLLIPTYAIGRIQGLMSFNKALREMASSLSLESADQHLQLEGKQCAPQLPSGQTPGLPPHSEDK
ncbi:MAG: hypothetical protein ABII39_07310 [Candidatus Micrarchaeota archaeon]